MLDQPSEITSGFRRVFSVPQIYRFAQRAVGADKIRNILVNDILRIEPGLRIVDIGCGPANILAYLPDVDYVGFDHSQSYIEAAQNRFRDRGRFINMTAGNVSLDSFSPQDLAMSIGVLHHLDDDEVLAALQTAKTVLACDGRFVSVDPTFVDDQHPIGRFLASRDRGQHVRTPNETEALVTQVFNDVSVRTRHDLLRVPYSHVLVEARTA